MTVYYSPASRGFYPQARQATYQAAGTWPADGVALSLDAYQALLAAQDAGKTIQPDADGFPVAVDPPAPPVPTVVTRRQARLALYQSGLLETVEAAIAAADTAIRIEYEAANFERDSSVVVAMSAQLGLTDTQLDALFTLAATL